MERVAEVEWAKAGGVRHREGMVELQLLPISPWGANTLGCMRCVRGRAARAKKSQRILRLEKVHDNGVMNHKR